MPDVLPHKLILDERKQLTVTGVAEVVSFEDTAAILRTPLGTLAVQGRDLKLKELSPEGGQVEVDGEISVLLYEEASAPKGWLGRLFG